MKSTYENIFIEINMEINIYLNIQYDDIRHEKGNEIQENVHIYPYNCEYWDMITPGNTYNKIDTCAGNDYTNEMLIMWNVWERNKTEID